MRRLTLFRRRDEQGAVIVLMTAFVVVMVGMAALVIDVGALRDEKRQLQNGADAAALGLAQYIGQNCPTAATCSPVLLQSKAESLAKANARDNATKVDPPIADYATKQVTVKTSTQEGDGGNILPFSFGQALTGVKGKEVRAGAAASWAGLKSASVVRLTVSRCEFNLATVNGTVFDEPKVILFHKSSPDCAGGPSGANLSGGFGWLGDGNDSNPNDCNVTPSAGNTVVSDTGNSAPNACKMATYLGKDVLLALFDGVSGSGSNGSYHIYGFAQLHITGFNFPSGGQGGVSCPTNACLVGKFIRFIAIGEIGGPNLGNRVALVS